MRIVDHKSTLTGGINARGELSAELALEALRDAKRTLIKLDLPLSEVTAYHDQDGVYIGHCWMYEIVVGFQRLGFPFL